LLGSSFRGYEDHSDICWGIACTEEIFTISKFYLKAFTQTYHFETTPKSSYLINRIMQNVPE
jgi:hypothetical protein